MKYPPPEGLTTPDPLRVAPGPVRPIPMHKMPATSELTTVADQPAGSTVPVSPGRVSNMAEPEFDRETVLPPSAAAKVCAAPDIAIFGPSGCCGHESICRVGPDLMTTSNALPTRISLGTHAVPSGLVRPIAPKPLRLTVTAPVLAFAGTIWNTDPIA